MNNIIVIAQARTGSDLVCEILRNIENGRPIHEIFIPPEYAENKDNYPYLPHHLCYTDCEKKILFNMFDIEYLNYPELIRKLKDDPLGSLRILDEIIPNTKMYKILDNQISLDQFKDIIALKNTKFILLERTCKLSQWTSRQIAEKNKVWDNRPAPLTRIHIDREEFLEFKKDSMNWYCIIRDELNRQNHNFLEINYEQDLDRDSLIPVWNKINKWLISENENLVFKQEFINLKKHNTFLLSEKIDNYDEVKDLKLC